MQNATLHYHNKRLIEIANKSAIIFQMYNHSQKNKSQGPHACPLIPPLDDTRRVRWQLLFAAAA